MNNEARNARAAGVLIACMTVGALVLFALEPQAPRLPRGALLMAEAPQPVEGLVIEYVAPGASVDTTLFDCVIQPTGEVTWQPTGELVRLAVVGSDFDRLPARQAEQLLNVIGQIRFSAGLALGNVMLGSSADPVAQSNLPPQTHDLRGLLVRKGIVR